MERDVVSVASAGEETDDIADQPHNVVRWPTSKARLVAFVGVALVVPMVAIGAARSSATTRMGDGIVSLSAPAAHGFCCWTDKPTHNGFPAYTGPACNCNNKQYVDWNTKEFE